MKTFKRIETKLIHSGEPHPRVMGAVSLPIFQTAMFEYAGEESYHDIRYIRLNNSPNHVALHQKLAALENALLSKKLDEQIRPDGRPVHEGHISSYFGERQDPFNGHQAFHKGIDFASAKGSDVIAVAAGVVTFAGEKVGYGTLVEVSHGNGLITRYGHNSGLAVGVGRTVARGDTLAYVGSTGRSTGPHVHFEVLKNGRQIDPLTFIGR